MKIRKKLLAWLQLLTIIVSLGVGSTYPAYTQFVYADDTEKSSSSEKDDDSNKEKEDPSSQDALKKLEEKIGAKNNIMNSKFPTAAQEAAVEGPLKYDTQTQLLITYSILSDKYPASKNYGDIYKTGGSAVDELQKIYPNLELKKMGTDNLVKSFTDSTKSSAQKETDSNMTNSEGIQTSSFKTDMSKEEMDKWVKDSKNQVIIGMLKPYAESLANNFVNAVSIGDDREPEVWASDDNKNSDDKWKQMLDNAGSVFDRIVNIINPDKKTKQSWGGAYGNDDLDDVISISKEARSIKDAMTTYYIKALLTSAIDNRNKIKSDKDLNKFLKSKTANNAGLSGKLENNADTYLISWANPFKEMNKAVGKSDDDVSKTTVQGKAKHLMIFPWGDQTHKASPNEVKPIVEKVGWLYPSQINNVTKNTNLEDSDWYKNYKTYINKNASGNSVSKQEFDEFNKLSQDLNKQKEKAKNAIGDNSVLSWVPTIPYNDEWNTMDKSSANFSNGYNSKNGVLMKGSEFGVLSTKNFIEKDVGKNYLWVNGAKKGPQLVIGGDPTQKITNNRSIYDFTALNNIKNKKGYLNKNTRVTYMYSDTMYNSSDLSDLDNEDIVGMDAYGNIIDGKNFKVIIPYWQNSTIKDLTFSKPFAYTNMPIKGDGWISGVNGEGSVSDNDIKKVVSDEQAQKDAIAIRDALQKDSNTKTKNKFISAVNNAVGENGSELSQKGAAGLATVITAGTYKQVEKVNAKILSGGKSTRQLYIGETIEINKKDNQKGTGLYTAADVIQRYGLTTDFGLFDIMRKTIATWLVSTYNSEISQGGSQNVFYTEVFGEDGSLLKFGTQPYFYAILFLEVVIGVVSVWQYYRGGKASLFIKRFVLFTVLAIGFGLFGSGTIPKLESVILNKPLELLTNGPMKRESVLDQWSKLKQQQNINNVFYQGLFQDKYGQVNRSTNYLVPFYTSTTMTGAIDPSVSDPQSDFAKQSNSAADQLTPNEQLINKATYRLGNGKVPLTTPYKYKKVYVTLADLTNWASHMSRQRLSAEGKIVQGSAQYEAPNEGFEPGKEPLFHWLAKNYQKIPAGDQTSEGNKEFEFMDDSYGDDGGSSDSDSSSDSNSSEDSDSDSDKEDSDKDSDKDSDSKGDEAMADPNKVHATISADETDSSEEKSDENSDSSEEGSDNSESSDDFNSDDSDHDPSEDYGKKLNPADTTGKSSYDTNNRGAWLDNSKMYTNFDKYAEFAAQTKHYANKDDKKYGIDVDSGGGQVTASQMFLELWSKIFDNSGENGLPGDAESFTALMNFAQAMNGKMGDQVSDTTVGTDTGNGLNKDLVGSVGRNSLINELSMTKYQRSLLNGNKNYSNAAQQMIDTFKIPAGSSDYFNLDKDGSIIDIMRPYAKNQKARDALIFDINKKVLNDYVNLYSDVRAQVNPSNANSTNDDGNNQPTSDDDPEKKETGEDNRGVDAFTMAEAQVVASDIFFTINQQLGYKMFPQGFSAKSISLDSWNRMLFVPIGAMKQLNDNSSYDSDNKSAAANIALQDNVIEYLALQSPLGTLFIFTIMNYAMIGFGYIMKILFLFFLPVTIIMSVFRYFIFQKGSLKGLFMGSMFMIILFSAVKFMLGLIFMYRSNILNKNWSLADGLVDPSSTFGSSFIVLLFLIAVYLLVFSYIKFIFRNFWTLGAGENGQLLGGFLKSAAMSPKNIVKRANKFRADKLSSFWHQRRLNNNGSRKITRAISNHVKNIGFKTGNIAKAKLDPITRRINDTKLMAKLSKGKRYFKRNKPGFSNNLNNMLNARVGGIDATGSNGIDIEALKRAGINNGNHLDDIKKMQVSYDTGLNSDFAKNTFEKVLKSNDLSNRFTLENGKLITRGINNAMLNSAAGRKEIFNKLHNGIIDELSNQNGKLGSGKIRVKAKGKNIVLPEFDPQAGNYLLDVSKTNGIDPEQLQKLLDDRKFNKYFNVVKVPVKQKDGSYTNGSLRFVLNDLDKPIDKTKAFDTLSKLTKKYIDDNEFTNSATKSVDVGNNLDILNQVGFEGYHNGKIYSNDENRLKLAQKLVNSRKESLNELANFMDASSSYIVDGNNHGLKELDIKTDSNNITKRFIANNQDNLNEGMLALSKLAKTPNFVAEAQDLQNSIDNSIMNSLGGPVQLVNKYQQAIQENGIKPSALADKQMKEILDLARSTGTNQFKDMPTDIQNTMTNKLNILNKQLSDDRILNDLQTNIISSGSIPNAKDLIESRRNLINSAGLDPSKSAKIFKNMTSGQLAEYSAQIGSMKNIKVDDNGIMSVDIEERLANDKRKKDLINTRISNMIKNLS